MIKLIVVGKMKNRALAELCEDYKSRISRYCPIEICELKDSTPQKEGEKMLESLEKFKGKVYVMSEEGLLLNSVKFSKSIESDLQYGGSAFVIGSAYGLSEKIKQRADYLISLSPMTFTHEFARAILLEQIYRAKNISANTGYHH